MPPGGGRGSTGASTSIPTQASGDTHQHSESRSGMRCTSAPSVSARRHEKDAKPKRSTTAITATATGGSFAPKVKHHPTVGWKHQSNPLSSTGLPCILDKGVL